MEATKLFRWFSAIYLPTIGAHNHIVYSPSTFSPNIFILWLTIPLFVFYKKGYITWSNLSLIILLQYIIWWYYIDILSLNIIRAYPWFP